MPRRPLLSHSQVLTCRNSSGSCARKVESCKKYRVSSHELSLPLVQVFPSTDIPPEGDWEPWALFTRPEDCFLLSSSLTIPVPCHHYHHNWTAKYNAKLDKGNKLSGFTDTSIVLMAHGYNLPLEGGRQRFAMFTFSFFYIMKKLWPHQPT